MELAKVKPGQASASLKTTNENKASMILITVKPFDTIIIGTKLFGQSGTKLSV